MRASWRAGSLKRGRMSSNKIPGLGKSGNWRRDLRSLIVRLESSEEAAEVVEGNPLSETSGWFVPTGGCDEVESRLIERDMARGGIRRSKIGSIMALVGEY